MVASANGGNVLTIVYNVSLCRCLVVPWLLVSMLQLVLLGCPTVIFFSLLGTYLLLQV